MKPPFKNEKKSGVNEKIHSAQIIIDYFSKGLEDAGCLARLPMALHAEVDGTIAHLSDLVSAVTGEEAGEFTPEVIVEDENGGALKPEVVNEDKESSELEKRVMDSMFGDCIACEFTPPDFSAEMAMFANAVLAGELLLDNILLLDGDFNPDLCALIYLLSYQCIPDLIKMLAAILTRITILTADLSLGEFGLSAFISGIIGAMLKALMGVVSKIAAAAFEPMRCLIDAMMKIIGSLPTAKNLRDQMTRSGAPQAEFDNLEKGVVPTAPHPEDMEAAVDDFKDAVQSTYQNTSNGIKGEFQKIADTFEASLDSINDEVTKLISTFLHVDCEKVRTGQDITAKIRAIKELVGIANMLSAVISNKGKLAAIREMCSDQTMTSIKSDGTVTTVSTEFVAAVVEEAFDVTADIVESEGGDLSILITPTVKNVAGLPADIFNCTLDNFIEGMDIASVVKESVRFVNAEIINAEGEDPQVTIFNKSVLNQKNITFDPSYQKLIPIKISGLNVHADFAEVIESVLTTDFMSVKKPKTEWLGSGNELEVVESKDVPGELSNIVASGRNANIGGTIQSNSSTVVARNIIPVTERELACGSVDSILERFGSL